MTTPEGLSVRLAGALLVYKGEISMYEIRALPFVETDELAEAIVNVLSRSFDVERFQRLVGRTAPHWEDVIRLRRSPQLKRPGGSKRMVA